MLALMAGSTGGGWSRKDLFVGLAMAALCSTSMAAQAPTLAVTDSRSCAACQVQVDFVVSLGTTEGPGLIASDYTHAVGDGDDNFYVFNSDGGDIVNVFGKDGTFLRTLGAHGQGPGEFEGVTTLRIDSESNILVFDRAQRVNVFSPRHEFLRVFRLEIMPNPTLVLTGDGSMVVVSDETTPATVGLPFHAVDSNGKRLRSFGSDADESYYPGKDSSRLYFQTLAPSSRAGHVWSVRKSEYRIDLWDELGDKQLTIQRRAGWFPTTSGPISGDEPFVIDIQEGEDGVLWVLTLVPAGDWEAQMARDRRTSRRLNEDYWDTVIEAIDLRKGELIAHTQVPQYLRFVDRALIGGVSDRGLDSFFHVYKIQLTSTEKEKEVAKQVTVLSPSYSAMQ